MTVSAWRSPFAAAATVTDRTESSANQDAVVVLNPEQDGCCAVVLCDGIGSWDCSGVTSQVATQRAAAVLRQYGPSAIDKAFAEAQDAVLSIGREWSGAAAKRAGGTTMLVATVPEPGELLLGYVGNGAALECRPVHGVNAPMRVQWSNHLVPHSGIEHGQEVLTRALTTESVLPLPVSLLRIRPTENAVLLLSSDGIWSQEQAPLARTADGQRWMQLPPVLLRTLDLAGQVLSWMSEEDEEEVLASDSTARPSPNEAIQAHLDALRSDDLLDDDSTIGLLAI